MDNINNFNNCIKINTRDIMNWEPLIKTIKGISPLVILLVLIFKGYYQTGFKKIEKVLLNGEVH